MRRAPQRGRIGFVFSSLHFGGAERVALNLATALKAEGYDVEFVLMTAAGEFLAKAEEEFGIVDLRCDRTWKLPFKLARYLLRDRPTAVISSFWKLNICLAAARIISPSTAIALWEHSSPQVEGNSPTWLFAPTASILYRLATCIVTVSGNVADDIAKRSLGLRNKIVTIGNAIPAPAVQSLAGRNIPNDTYDLVWVGRLALVKNPMLMVEACGILGEWNVKFRLRFIGDGQLRPELEARLAQLAIADRVSFTGFVSDPYPLIGASDLLVISSATEGLPTVAIEAMYLGINVVSTDCGRGVHDILGNGRFGSVVQNHSPEALARGIAARLEMPIEPATLRNAAARYEPRSIARQFLQALGLKNKTT